MNSSKFSIASILGESGDGDEDESEDENSDTDVDYSWKKAIMIGSSYQACVPVELCCEQDEDIIEQGKESFVFVDDEEPINRL